MCVCCVCYRVLQLDEENSELRSCVPCLRANIERLEEVRTILVLIVSVLVLLLLLGMRHIGTV